MRARLHLPTLVAGLVTLVIGGILVLDQSGSLSLSFGYLWPLLAAATGAVLLASGLDRRP